MTHAELFNTIYQYLPKGPTAQSGWQSFNCVMCPHNGEPTPDKKKRGGLLITNNGFTYNCFRCKFKTHWEYGYDIHPQSKLHELLTVCGMNEETFKRVSFETYRLNRLGLSAKEVAVKDFKPKQLEFAESKLPANSHSLLELINTNCTNRYFYNILLYANKRNILDPPNMYWSTEKRNQLSNRLIIPYKYKDKIVGYTARIANDNAPKSIRKYHSEVPAGYMYNIDKLNNPDIKRIVLVEGVLDAMAIGAVGFLGNKLSNDQLAWIRQSGKEVILLPDFDKAGLDIDNEDSAINTAIANNWAVSFPNWSEYAKDAQESVNVYGKLATVCGIVQGATNYRVDILTKARLKYNRSIKS